MSAACTSARSAAAVSAAPIAPAPQHRSTITCRPRGTGGRIALPKGDLGGCVSPKGLGGWVSPTASRGGRVPAGDEQGAGGCAGSSPRISKAACQTRNSVRRRGTNTPGATAIRRPQNSAQPRTCSSGRPTARWPTMASSSAGVRAADTSSRASSSAKTQPAARSLLAICASETDTASAFQDVRGRSLAVVRREHPA